MEPSEIRKIIPTNCHEAWDALNSFKPENYFNPEKMKTLFTYKGHTMQPGFGSLATSYAYEKWSPKESDVLVAAFPKTGLTFSRKIRNKTTGLNKWHVFTALGLNWTTEIIKQLLFYKDEVMKKVYGNLPMTMALLEGGNRKYQTYLIKTFLSCRHDNFDYLWHFRLGTIIKSLKNASKYTTDFRQSDNWPRHTCPPLAWMWKKWNVLRLRYIFTRMFLIEFISLLTLLSSWKRFKKQISPIFTDSFGIFFPLPFLNRYLILFRSCMLFAIQRIRPYHGSNSSPSSRIFKPSLSNLFIHRLTGASFWKITQRVRTILIFRYW